MMTVQGRVVLNADTPDGRWLKGGAVGLDVGGEWHGGPSDSAHLYVGATVGGRIYAEPGIGLVVNAMVGGQVSLDLHLALFAQVRAGVGIARVGDESPNDEIERACDGTAGVRLHF